MGWLNSHAIGLCVSTTTTVKNTKAAQSEIEVPRQVLNHNLIFLAVGPDPYGTASGSGPGPPVSDLCAKPTTCMLDPIPSKLLKEVLHEIIDPLLTIINLPLSFGYIPKIFKP